METRDLPTLLVGDGKLAWRAPQPAQRAVPDDHAVESPPLSAADQALIAANRARIEQLKTLPRGADDLDLGTMLGLVARRAAPDVALTITGLTLSAAGLVPIALWEAAVLAIAGAGSVTKLIGRHRDHPLVRAGSNTAEELWKVHPGFVMSALVTRLQATVEAADVDDSDLEDELDAFYPRWSRTDFEFDPRRFMP